jgi:hypothetical protein
MAFSIRLTGMKWHDGKYRVIEIPAEISGDTARVADLGFRRIAISTGHLDYFATLSVSEALELVQHHYEGLSAHFRSTQNQALENLKRTDFVLAHLFEWDSGLG